MNRQIRRLTAKVKKHKPAHFQQQPLYLHRIEKRRRDFLNIDDILNTIQNREVEYIKGKPYYYDHIDGKHYGLVASLQGWADYWLLITKRYQTDLDADVFNQIANCLNYCTPIQQSTIERALNSVVKMKEIYLQLSPAEIQDMVTTAEIKFELEKENDN